MASTGNKYPGTVANVDRSGNNAWSNTGNVVSDNSTYTSGQTPTDYLVLSNFSLGVPAGSTINGVTVRVEAQETGSGNSNYIPQLISDTTPTLIGSAKSAVTVSGTTDTVSTNGGASDTWGATLTADIVNSSGFGVAIWSDDTTNILFFDYVTIAVDYTPPAVATGAGSLTLTGNAPSVTTQKKAVAGLGALTVTGYAPTVFKTGTNTNVSTGVGALTITGQAPTLTKQTMVSAGVGSLTLTGLAPTTKTVRSVSTGVGALTVTGLAPTTSRQVKVFASAGELSFTGYAPDVSASSADRMRVSWIALKLPESLSQTAQTQVGSLAITGYAPTVKGGNTSVLAGVGTLTLAGLAPTLTKQVRVSAGVASLTLTGQAPSVTKQALVSAGAGALTFTGLSPTVTKQTRVAANVGSLSLTGLAPQIQVTAQGAISVPAASLTLTGYAPTVTAQILLATDVGQIILTGYEPTVSSSETVEVSRGQQPAGGKARKLSKRKRKPILVRVDDQEFVVSSEYEAHELLEVAKESAKQKAEKEAEEILGKRKAKAAKDGRLNTSPLRLDEPKIEITPAQDGYIDRAWVDEVNRLFNDAIETAYSEASQRVELILLLMKQQEVDEEDTLVALLLTI